MTFFKKLWVNRFVRYLILHFYRPRLLIIGAIAALFMSQDIVSQKVSYIGAEVKQGISSRLQEPEEVVEEPRSNNHQDNSEEIKTPVFENEILAYKFALVKVIQQQVKYAYPTRERFKRSTGEVVLRFSISPSGQLTDVIVVNSSGNPNLDAAAVKAIQLTKAPPPPEGFPEQISVPVRFSIE